MVEHKKKILIIDDEEACHISIHVLLKNSNYKIMNAISGVQALKILKDNDDIDLILLDLMLPDIYGIDLLAQIKDNYKDSKIIMQTGSSDWNEIKKAKNLGAIGLIRKPYKKETLNRIIENSLI